jgi:cell division transport system permease protein
MIAKTDRSNQRARNAPVKAYFIHHARTLIASLGVLSRNPLSSLMTIAVIAIALALPTGMYASLNNISKLSIGWDNSAQISIFLKTHISEKQARALARKIALYSDVERVDFIHKKQALIEFQRISGFADAINSLGKNPLPHVLAVQPHIDKQRPDKINQLLKTLRKHQHVDMVQLDLQWVKRLYTMLEIAHKGIWVIALLLGVAVLLVVGNTIRLDIQNRRAEIEVTKLIGATNAFIRRPFLYTGLWYGVSGGALAWILTSLSIGILDDSVSKLALLYSSDFQLSGLGFTAGLTLILFSSLLGLLGSWLAVSRHLHEIEPS